jgi:hypothetical protein
MSWKWLMSYLSVLRGDQLDEIQRKEEDGG